MRTGVVVSIIGHIGAVMLTMLAWEARPIPVGGAGVIVPIEIVDVAAESNVRALTEDVPDEDLAPEQELETAEAAPAPAPGAAERRPRPPAPDEFDLNAVARMVNTETETGRRRQEGDIADRNQRGAGAGTAAAAALEDRAVSLVDRHLRRCWRMPDDLPDPERLVVTVSFQVNRNGDLSGQPRVVSPRNYTFDAPMTEAVNRALRAIRQCDPYTVLPEDPIVGEHFDVWRELEITFGRRQ